MYKHEAEGGNVDVQYNLGCFFDNGTGVAVDKRAAVKWYKSCG